MNYLEVNQLKLHYYAYKLFGLYGANNISEILKIEQN